MKTFAKSLVVAFVATLSLAAAVPAFAMTPTLTVTREGNWGDVRLTVRGDAWSRIDEMGYKTQDSSLWTRVTNLGQLDSSGYYTGVFSIGSVSNQAEFYVTVNGQRSPSAWLGGSGGCTGYNCGGSLSLSQTNIGLSVGQSASVTAYSSSGTVYVSNNSNSSVASASASGNTISIYAYQTGSTTITVCSGNGCASIYVTVSGSGSGSITFSQSNVALNAGQSATVTIYGSQNYPYSNYYVASNSNSSVVSASVSGNILTLIGQNNGSSTLSICQNNGGCGYVYVTVSGSGSGSGNVYFSPSSVSLTQNQSSTATIYNNSSVNNPVYYISSNSNSSVVSASISGSTLHLNGLANGYSTITVCMSGYGSNCGTLSVTVSGNQGGGSFWLNQSSLNVNVGQSATVQGYTSQVMTGWNMYVSANTNPSVASASISGSVVTVYGNQSGSTTMTICHSAVSQCQSLHVTVSGGNNIGTTVEIRDNYYSPSTITVNSGTTVTWRNYGSQNHTVTSQDGSFSSGTIYPGGSYTYTFNNSGTYSYYCQFHSMSGSVTVNYGGSGSGNLYFTSTSLPQAYINQYYSSQLQVSGGNAPYTYTVTSGSLPAGMTLSSSGQIFGTPINTGSASFTVRVQDYYGRAASQYFTMQPVCLSGGCVQGNSTYGNGQLIMEGQTVYITYKNTKTGFSSRQVFEGLGFNFGMPIAVGYSGIPDSGYTVTTASASHPWGTWVKSGSTVYFVHESGLIPVPDYYTFTSNGGQDRFVVSANWWDMQRPMQSVMVQNDWRLR